MSGHLGDGGDGEEDDWFRPVWEGGEDDADAAPPWASPAAVRARRTPAAGAGWDRDPRASAALLSPALAAADALARLDARAGAAGEAVREGLARRLALHEAAGWLAAQAAWVHPLDLALRAGHVAGPFGLAAAVGRTHAEMPNTAAACRPSATSLRGIGEADGAGSGWEALEDRDGAGLDDPFAAAHADGAAGRALCLARALERLALLGTRDPLRGDAAFGEALAALGAGEPDPARAAAWRRDILAAVGVHRPDRGGAPAPLPPLLAAARSAQAWCRPCSARPRCWRARA